ncbi:MAG TPA: hypothetical protein QGH10_21250, partial [Armatimonadota bacterium]|nr:hypothetical protein [Armatimonadota bacterium]
MVFSSHIFVFYFLPAVLALYYACPKRGRQLLIALVSYAFYGWANPWFVLLMLFSTVVDFAAGKLISGQWRLPMFRGDPPAGDGLPGARQRKLALVVSICTNRALLGVFTYLPFAQRNIN